MSKQQSYAFECAKCRQTVRQRKRRQTDEQRQARRERRKPKRNDKRARTDAPKVASTNIKITTWNLQGISRNERNRARIRRTVSFIKRKGWEITFISEVRARSIGVIYLGEGEDEAAIINSKRSGIILLGRALEACKAEGQKKNFADRVTSVQLAGWYLIAVYQPLWSNGLEGIEEYRHALENELSRSPNGESVIIGGDHNAHIGRGPSRRNRGP